MKERIVKCCFALVGLAILLNSPEIHATELFWRIDGTSATLTSSNWSTTGAAPFTSAWVNGSNITFSAGSSISYVSTTPVGNLTIAGGSTVAWAGTGTFSTNGLISTFDIGTGSTLTWTGQNVAATTGTGFIKNGAGTWNIANTMGTGAAPAGFTLNAGTIITSSANGLGGGTLTINGGTWQSTSGLSYNLSGVAFGGDFTLTGTGNAVLALATSPISLGAGTRTITNNTTSGSRQWLGIISGSASAGLIFAGNGINNDGGAQGYVGNAGNTFTGPISILGGEVVFNDNGTFGGSTSITLDGGRLTMAAMASNGNTTALTAGTIASSRNIFAGATAGSSISVTGATGVITYNGVIADKAGAGGTWAKQGAGMLKLGGSSTYTGATAINNGTLQLTTGNDRLPAGTVLSLGQAGNTNLGILDLNGFSQTIGGLVSTNGINALTTVKNLVTSAAAATLTVNNSVDCSFGSNTTTNSGLITGAISLVKNGSGTLTLGDSPNATFTSTYTGSTQIIGGTLIVSGSIASSSGMSIGGGGKLRGTGTVPAVSGTGLIFPGTSTHANLPLNADETMSGTTLDLSAGGTFGVQVSNSGTGGVHKQLLVLSGAATLGGSSKLSVGSEAGSYGAGDIVILQTPAGGILNQFNSSSVPSGLLLKYLKAGGDVLPDGTAGNAADQVVLRPNGTVAPVKLESFGARADGLGVLLEWNCVSEFQNAGFNVFRRDALGGEWQTVNAALISGRVTNPDAKLYRLYDWAPRGQFEYKLESISIRGAVETCASIAGPIEVDGDLLSCADVSASGLEAAAERVSQHFAYARAQSLSAGIVVGQTFLSARSGRQECLPHRRIVTSGDSMTSKTFAPMLNEAHPAAFAGVRWLSSIHASRSFNAVKITYDKPGVLIVPQSALPAGFDIHRLSVQREGRALRPLALTADSLVLYGQGYQDDYTGTDAFFLRASSSTEAGLAPAAATGLFESTQSPARSSAATARAEFHDVYFDYGYRPYIFPPWFSGQYLSSGTDRNFTLDTPGASAGPATLTVNVWSLQGNNHALTALINGQPAGEMQWTGDGQMLQLAFQIPAGALSAGTNTVELVTPDLGTDGTRISFLHSFSIGYTRLLDASAPVTVVNSGTSAQLFELSNLPGPNAWVVDTRFPDRAALVSFQAQQQSGGTYNIRFVAAPGGSGEFLVVLAGFENAPLSVSVRQVKPAPAGAYLATGPAQFSAPVQPLLLKRAKDGLRGNYVDQAQLFDFYNFGRYGPNAIRNAVRAVRPKYLLLLGRTNYDYRNYSGANVDPLCPAFLVSTSFWAQTTSDSLFGDLGRGYPEVAVGRLPVNTAAELSVAVSRIVASGGIVASAMRVHAAADAPDANAGDFAAQAGEMHDALPNAAWDENYLGTTHQTSTEVNAALTQAACGGADVILYAGHGNSMRLGAVAPRILDTDSVQNWTGNAVFLQATCAANWMAKDESGFKSIAMQALTQPQGGISASIGTSTYMNSDVAAAFMTRLMTNANKGHVSWGAALMQAQQWAFQMSGGQDGFYADLVRTEQIFGDPAMPVFAVPAKSAGGASAAPGSF